MTEADRLALITSEQVSLVHREADEIAMAIRERRIPRTGQRNPTVILICDDEADECRAFSVDRVRQRRRYRPLTTATVLQFR